LLEEKNRKKWYEKCGGSELTDRARLLRDKLKKYQSFFEILDIASTILAINAIFVFIYYKNLHNTKNWIHVHLFIAVALTGTFRFLADYNHQKSIEDVYKMNETSSVMACRIFTSVENFFAEANYAWIFIEAFYLHTLISNPLRTNPYVTRYVIAGWVIPIVPTIGWALQYYSEDGKFDCIRKLDEDTFRLHLWFEIPNCVIAVTNVILFFHILYLIYKNLRYPDQDIRSQGEFGTGGNDMLRLARATLILVPLFGIHAFISLFVPSYEISTDFGTKFYAEVILLILDSTSGGLVALVYCFGTREVQDELRRSWRSRPCLSDR